MTAAASPPPPSSPSPKPVHHRRSQTLDAAIARANVIAAALPALLAGIAKADAKAESVRIGAPWVATLNGVIASAEESQGERATAKVAQKAATATERETAEDLAALLIKVRGLVETHNPTSIAAQDAYGRGEKIDGRSTSGTLIVARAYLSAWSGKFTAPATKAGVTQATMDQIASLANTLAQGSVAQRAALTSGSQGTLSRQAALAALVAQCAFAVKVVTNVYGKGSAELATLSDPRPMQARGADRKAATKVKAKASQARVHAKKVASRAKPGAGSKALARREQRAVVATRTAALLGAKAKAKTAKGTKLKSGAKRAK